MKLLFAIVSLVFMLMAAPAFADMLCVQRQLANLGYQPGTVDGAIGSKTLSAAASFLADFKVDLPVLDASSSGAWCDALNTAAQSADGISKRFDVTSEPSGVLSPAATEKLWSLYKHISECLIFDTVPGGKAVSFPMTVLRPQELISASWHTPFSNQVIGAPACKIDVPNFSYPPPPIPVVKLDERYGERQATVDNALVWFERAATYVRYSGDPVARTALKAAIIKWAETNSLTKGINVSWGSKPIDYQMLATVLGLLTATSEVAQDLSPQERVIVGTWLNGLIKNAADSRWKDRTDNKDYMRTYLGMLWGVIVGDDKPVRDGIEVYKRAIHDMRPDGSFPIDSQRGGMGVQYNGMAANSLLLIAIEMKKTFGLDLFNYSVDGRSVHTAIDFLIRSIQEPGQTNRIYAISCPESGDRWGTIEAPSTDFFQHVSGLLVYADLFPEDENAPWIRQFFAESMKTASITERAGGAPACQFATPTQVAFSGPSIEIAPVAVTPAPKLALVTREEIAEEKGMTGQVDSLFTTRIEGAPNGQNVVRYNLKGPFNIFKKTFYGLQFVVRGNLPEASAKPIVACGAGFDIKRYEDGKPNLQLKPALDKGEFVFPDLSCVEPYLTPDVKFMARFLKGSFRDIAISMIGDGSVSLLGHTGLQVWMQKVADGDIVLR
ncbi:alginate lyase family protein [Devosia sp.]|uniref:alginate lyase family protein n=1 Tax=Devosia sp. TaxID=1871048 RepID=UPI0032663B74